MGNPLPFTKDLRGLSAYTLAVILVVLATAARFVIAPQDSGYPYVTYFPAATLAAIAGGIGPGLFATLIGAIAASYFFIIPLDELSASSEAIVSALVFIADEVIVCGAIEAMRRYHQGYRSALDSLSQAHFDLSSAHRAEQAARQDAERANKAKSRFLAAASHDLRQPLQAMRLFLSVLAEKGAAQLPAILPRMEVAMVAVERLLGSILDLGKVEAGTIMVDPTEFQLGDVLDAFRFEYADQAAEANTRLIVVPCSATVRADRVIVQRILSNLLSNAIKYGAGGKVILGCRRQGTTIRVEVWDEGPGVPVDKRELIFEEFYQVGNAERDLSKGLGIGLAIARRLAHLSGFRLWLHTAPWGGCCFCLSLDGVIVTPSHSSEAALIAS